MLNEHLTAFLLRIKALFKRRQLDRDLNDELQFHLAMREAKQAESGAPTHEARYAARRQFGNLTKAKEINREMWTFPFLETLWQDVRYGLRQLRHNPGFTAVAVLTLALGIGANTAIFSVVNGVLLEPLPYSQPNRLIAIWEKNLHYGWHVWISYLNFRDWQRQARGFQSLAAFYDETHDLTAPGAAEHVEGDAVSSGFFATLGVKLALGREFTPQEDRQGGAPVAVISGSLWQSRFHGSPFVLGKPLTLDGVEYSVVGVLPPHFQLIGHPLVYTPLAQADPPTLTDRGAHDNMLAIGRLKAGVSMAQAQAEISAIQARLDRLYPKSDQGLGAALVPLREMIIGNVGGTLLLVLGAAGLVLLIACANVANLLLARAAARRREFAVRSALGGSRMRIVRQLVTESVLLSLMGGGAGLAIAAWGVQPVLALVPRIVPRRQDIHLSIPVLLFALGVAVSVGILFGIIPALKASSLNLQEALKEGARMSPHGQHRMQGGLVVFQMALTLVLLAGAGLLFRTIRHLWDSNPGFDLRHIVTFKVGVSPSLTKTPTMTRSVYRQLLERIQNVPGVEAAGFAWSLPLSGDTGQGPFWIDGHKPAMVQTAPRMLLFMTGPNYLRVMKIPLLQGRFFSPRDTTQSPCVMVIDSIFASTFFPRDNPLGHTISFGFDQVTGPCRIIGVVGHVRNAGLGKASPYARAQSYFPYLQDPDEWVAGNFRDASLMVRTPLAAAAIMPAIRKVVYGVGKNQPVYAVRTMRQIASESMASQRFPMILLGIFAGLALLLASVGVYGVISYSVTQRVHEFGIRMALGAQKQDVLRMVIGQGLRLAVTGLLIGAVAALILTRWLVSFSSLLFGVGAEDPATFLSVSLLLTGVTILAGYFPARRATKVDPMVALRHE